MHNYIKGTLFFDVKNKKVVLVVFLLFLLFEKISRSAPVV